MARLLMGLLIAALLLAACDSGPEVPDGFTEAEAPPVTFAHPEDWTEGSPAGGAVLQIEAPGEDGTRSGVQVFVDDETGDPGARATAMAAGLRTTFEDFDIIGQAETEVDGSESATLLEYTFTRPEGGTVHAWDVVALGPDGEQVVIFRVEGSEDDLDEDTAQQILDTLSVG